MVYSLCEYNSLKDRSLKGGGHIKEVHTSYYVLV